MNSPKQTTKAFSTIEELQSFLKENWKEDGSHLNLFSIKNEKGFSPLHLMAIENKLHHFQLLLNSLSQNVALQAKEINNNPSSDQVSTPAESNTVTPTESQAEKTTVDSVTPELQKNFRDELELPSTHAVYSGYTCFHLAAFHGHYQLVKFFLDNNLVGQIDRTTSEGLSALQIVASQAAHPALVRLLVEKGADINLQNKLGLTSLMMASNKGFIATVSALLECQALPNLQDSLGDTALHHAFQVELQRLFDNRWEVQFENRRVAYKLACCGANPHQNNNDEIPPTTFCSLPFAKLLDVAYKMEELGTEYGDLEKLLNTPEEEVASKFTEEQIQNSVSLSQNSLSELIATVNQEIADFRKELESRPFCPFSASQDTEGGKCPMGFGSQEKEQSTSSAEEQQESETEEAQKKRSAANKNGKEGGKCPFPHEYLYTWKTYAVLGVCIVAGVYLLSRNRSTTQK